VVRLHRAEQDRQALVLRPLLAGAAARKAARATADQREAEELRMLQCLATTGPTSARRAVDRMPLRRPRAIIDPALPHNAPDHLMLPRPLDPIVAMVDRSGRRRLHILLHRQVRLRPLPRRPQALVVEVEAAGAVVLHAAEETNRDPYSERANHEVP
jgi:hypothetical protein